MGTKVGTLADRAGVTCPKETGEMDKNTPCTECEHFNRCKAALFTHLVEDT